MKDKIEWLDRAWKTLECGDYEEQGAHLPAALEEIDALDTMVDNRTRERDALREVLRGLVLQRFGTDAMDRVKHAVADYHGREQHDRAEALAACFEKEGVR